MEAAVLEAGQPAASVDTGRAALVHPIATSTRGAGGLRRMMLGSAAESVVRTSGVPVMLVTPADPGIDETR